MIFYDFRLHRDRASLDGNQYVEIQTAAFEQTYWLEGSVYIHADVFVLFDGLLRGRCGYEDVYSTVDLDRETVAMCARVWREVSGQIEAGEVLAAVRRLGIAGIPLIDGELRLQAPAVVMLLRELADHVESLLDREGVDRIACVGL